MKPYINISSQTFNSSYVYQQFGYVQVSSAALAAHQQLYLDITIPTGGYLYTYVANESNVSASTSVYGACPAKSGDDFNIIHTRNTNTLQVVQTTDYYPFGLAMAAQSYQKQSSLDNDYLYNGKELQDEHNLGWLDYGARMSMSDIGRWGVVDPLAESRTWLSPYNYVQNNPLILIDPSGMLDVYALDKESGEISFIKEQEGNDVLVDKESNEVVDGSVERGILQDGMNIKENGLQTSNVSEGTNLAVNISMHTGKELTGTVYEDSKGAQMLNVLPYNKADVYEDNGKVTGTTTGHSSEVITKFTSNDGNFSGTAVSSFHTHVGHPTNPGLGTANASTDDRTGAIMNGFHKGLQGYEYHIYSKYNATIGGQSTNHSIYYMKREYPKGQSFHQKPAIPWKP